MKKTVLWLLLCAFFAATLVPSGNANALPGVSPRIQSNANELIAAVNTLRAASGLPEYTVNSILMGTAQAQANFMASIGSVTHSGPGGIGLTQRLLNAGYPLAGDLSQGGFRAENITGGPGKSANQAIQEWLGDAAHINTMLSPNLHEIGAGVAVSGGTVYYVIDCAQPTTGGVPQANTTGGEASTAGNASVVGTPGEAAIPQYMAPVLTATPDVEGLVYHEVLYGQSLWSLAIAYGVKIEEIRSLNNLSPEYVIQTGDRLLVRKDAPPPLASPTSTQFPTPISQTLVSTATSILTSTVFAVTETPVVAADKQKSGNSFVGSIVGIVLLALLFAGGMTWIGARKPV